MALPGSPLTTAGTSLGHYHTPPRLLVSKDSS